MSRLIGWLRRLCGNVGWEYEVINTKCRRLTTTVIRYESFKAHVERALDEKAREGWRLVTKDGDIYIFERRIPRW